MSIPDSVVGSRNSGYVLTWKRTDGTTHDLSGSTLSGNIRDKNGTSRAIDGDLALSDAANGVFTWAPGAVDVGTAGKFRVQFIAAYTASSKNDLTYAMDWVVREAL